MVRSNRAWSSVSAIRPSSPNAWCACASENMSGYTRAPRCSSGTRRAQSPRLPPAMEGEADMRSPCRPLNGCGRIRLAQSMMFLRTPGIDALYSGEAMRNASAASSRSLSRNAPGATPLPTSTSRS